METLKTMFNYPFVKYSFGNTNLNFYDKNGPSVSTFNYLIILVFSLTLIQIVSRLKVVLSSQRGKLKASPIPESFTKAPSFPIVGPLLHVLYHINGLPEFFLDWTCKYGPNFRLKMFGRHFVMLNDPASVQKLLMSGDLGHVQKPFLFYRAIFTDSLVNGLVSSQPKLWKSHRSVLTKGFTYESLKHYLGIINMHSQKLIVELQDSIQSTENFLEKIPISTFGVISHIVTGTDMLTEKDSTTFYLNFHRAQEIVTNRLLQPWLLLDFLWNIHPMKKELDNCIDQITKDIYHVRKLQLEQASKPSLNTETPIRSLMEVMDASGMSDLELCTEVASILLAGHDTASVTFFFFMFNLALYPKHQEACREEVDEMFNGLSDSGSGMQDEITIEKLSELKYLERCLKESLRVYPSVPLICRELGSPLKLDNDVVLDTGVTVLISPWTLHRHPDHYSDPEKFDPDRFLPENCKKRHNGCYIPFSTGPRNCLGWKLAMMEIKVLAAYILRHFKVITTDSPDAVKLVFNVVLGTDKKLNVLLKRRQL